MFEQITGMFTVGVDFIFGPLAVFGPAISLFLISSFITILVILLNRLVTNKKIVSELKERMEEIKEQLTDAQKSGNKDEVSKFLDEMMGLNAKYMKHMYKTLLVSLVAITIFLPWIRYSYSGMAVAQLPVTLPLIGSQLNWIFWYILVSFTIGWVVRKVFGFE